MKHEDGRFPCGYNGWKNKETWLVHLWLTNDPGTYEAAREAALQGPESLKTLVEERVLPEEASLAADLLSTALAWVDWEEVAGALAEE
ncbi:MAG: hypothetical protein KM312_04950 [Hydrogenibacillus schlegelii]|uniref:Uncharacterized protein n=1 Tax=Hydrogenibacillus schlegelii TaxID=1484 RepID=A0A947CWG5_HYDSH|nr:hypothetical protein [Hydrogenibacillus schlegelii]